MMKYRARVFSATLAPGLALALYWYPEGDLNPHSCEAKGF